jgi:hypothetical protein
MYQSQSPALAASQGFADKYLQAMMFRHRMYQDKITNQYRQSVMDLNKARTDWYTRRGDTTTIKIEPIEKLTTKRNTLERELEEIGEGDPRKQLIERRITELDQQAAASQGLEFINVPGRERRIEPKWWLPGFAEDWLAPDVKPSQSLVPIGQTPAEQPAQTPAGIFSKPETPKAIDLTDDELDEAVNKAKSLLPYGASEQEILFEARRILGYK